MVSMISLHLASGEKASVTVRLTGEFKVIIQLSFFIALASAADLACLEISSRTKDQKETWSVIVKVFSSDIGVRPYR